MNSDNDQPYNIGYLCTYTGISRSSYYKWLNHGLSQRQIDDQAVVKYMIELEEQHNYIYGVESLTMYVNKNTKYHVGHNKVRRLMAENEIKASIRVKKHDRHEEHKEQLSANLLYDADKGHNFHPDEANHIWVTDCSELRYGLRNQYRLRLSAIKDLYDHSIIAWQVAETETSVLVTDTIRLALENTNAIKPAILHSDQGSSYTSGEYNTFLAGHGINHSMSRAGTPGDNSPIESFWSHMKDEFFAFRTAQSKSELLAQINEFIRWYNFERLQVTLNGMTPIEYRNHAVQECA
ncbi:IS3 family transposase [Streptomonospora sediminis]|uniref:IS3 family transposase n=1 Tax=Pediococcus parvulus TaxID=54062 RepID=UPI0021A5D64D|nr:IS3 family transposase [Pediococcus parvulus]